MAKTSNQKLKLLYIIKILSENTDESHLVTTQELIDRLAAYDIAAERKSVYDDINRLIDFGYDIIAVRSKANGGYYMASREFESAELKLLVDAVQASRFITVKKSRELIKKLEKLTNKYDAQGLQRQVYVAGRIKTENESIYYNVDAIHQAIHSNRKIRFTYLEWTINKELKPRKSGEIYAVSPIALLWQDENYYMAAYDLQAGKVKHYRVDKMGQVTVTEEKREGMETYEDLDLAKYTEKTFGMFGGEEEAVTLRFSNKLVGVVIDRFGKEIEVRRQDASGFTVRVKVAVSGQFFGWLAGLGSDAVILSDKRTKEQYEAWLKEILERHESTDSRTDEGI